MHFLYSIPLSFSSYFYYYYQCGFHSQPYFTLIMVFFFFDVKHLHWPVFLVWKVSLKSLFIIVIIPSSSSCEFRAICELQASSSFVKKAATEWKQLAAKSSFVCFREQIWDKTERILDFCLQQFHRLRIFLCDAFSDTWQILSISHKTPVF